jgi:HK97 family phage major capsid protein
MPQYTKKEFESRDSKGESKDLKDNLHIKEELIMKEENLILSENEGNEVQSEADDRVSGEEKMFRSVDLSRAEFIDEDKRTVRIALTSEAPVRRPFGWEILDHSQESINTDFISQGRAPLLLDHDMSRQIGVIEKFQLDEDSKRTLAKVRFGRSELASEIWQDVVDGIRSNVSVGYSITNMERDNNADEPTYRVAFTPLEASIVSIPADQSANVGVARSEPSEINPGTETESNEETVEVADESNTQTIEEKTMSEVETKDIEINVDDVRKAAVKETRESIARANDEILELGSRHNQSELARKAIREGVSIEDFRGQLLNSLPVDQPLDTKEIGLTEKETRQFSILKAVRAMANPADIRAQEAAKFEFECSAAAKDTYGRNTSGLTLPAEVMHNWNARDINTSDDAGGVGERFLPGSFIEALRNASGVIAAGATLLRDLEDNVKIPKATGTSTAAWISAEGGAAAESEMTLGSVTMSPKTASMYTEVTNQMMQQSTLDMENIIRNDLAAGIANLIDTGALAGSGSSGQPTGIDNQTGVNTQSFATAATPTFAEIVAMEGSVLGDNVVLSNPGYLTTSAVAANMKSTSKDTGSGTFILDNGQANGHPVYVSNAVASGVAYFGNWADLLIGFFGGIDILVDPYSNSANSVTRLRATQFVDIAVRHAQSFTKGSA